jgi:agmatinase
MGTEFNPDINNGNGIFGLPFGEDESMIHIIPVPWDLTASYGRGSANGPDAIFLASFQLDLFREFFPDFWKSGLFMFDIPDNIKKLNTYYQPEIQNVVNAYNEYKTNDENIVKTITEVNDACYQMNQYVYEKALNCISRKKLPVVLGGDHSSPLGLITALSETNEHFGILHVDAHTDLRKNYQGFTFSHASIMYNVLKLNAVSKIVQIGTRDYCTEEDQRIKNSQSRILGFTDRYIQHMMYEGTTWQELCVEIIDELPYKVYISFDIDGLSPEFCPNTGTPVPGGLSLNQVLYLIEGICESGRKIIGADLCEVAPATGGVNEFDANVGARTLLELCMYLIYSNTR